jgi:AbrB family looped-hinge helix DNA binding protein
MSLRFPRKSPMHRPSDKLSKSGLKMATQTIKLSSRGQVVIPKLLRTAHRWKPGTEFEVEERGEEVVLRPKDRKGKTRLEDLVGCVNYKGPRKTIREIDQAVAEEALRHK